MYRILLKYPKRSGCQETLENILFTLLHYTFNTGHIQNRYVLLEIINTSFDKKVAQPLCTDADLTKRNLTGNKSPTMLCFQPLFHLPCQPILTAPE